MFGEKIYGEKAPSTGLAWGLVDDVAVDHRAIDLAQRVAADPNLARVGVANSVRGSQRRHGQGRHHAVRAASPEVVHAPARQLDVYRIDPVVLRYKRTSMQVMPLHGEQ